VQKIIPVGSWNFGMEPVETVKVASAGFTFHDKKAFLKKRGSAEEFAETIKNAELQPGDVPIHVIAIGETERFSYNRNADGFSRHTCKTAHPTFVKHARYFRNHKKGGVELSYGLVKASSYNPDMGRIELLLIGNGTKEAAKRNGGNVMPDATLQKLASGEPVAWSMGCGLKNDVCFVEGTEVATESGYRPIETIQLSDVVWTHDLTLHKVNHLYSQYSNNVGTFQVGGVPCFQGVTGNHPFLAFRQETFRKEGDCLGTAAGRPVRHTDFSGTRCGRCGKTVEADPEWIAVSELKQGDFVCTPVDASSKRTFYAGSFGYVLGMFLGDGCISYSRKGSSDKYAERSDKAGGLIFACNAEQPDILAKLKTACQSVSDGKVKCYAEGYGRDGRVKKGVSVNLTDRELALRMLKFGGEYCRGKRLHPEVFKWSEPEKAGVIAGYIDSDGCVDREHGAIRICSINKGLLLDVRRLCLSLGLHASVGINNKRKTGYSAKASENPGKPETCWKLSIAGNNLNETLNESVKICSFRPQRTQKTSYKCFFYKEWYLSPVTSVWSLLEPEKGLTRVYNVRVDRKSSYLVNGIAVHNCDNCHNKAASASEYCDEGECFNHLDGEPMFGCKHGLTKISASGHIQGVDNPDPIFHDISEVTIPADRTAYGWMADYLQKTASLHGEVVPSCVIGEQVYGVTPSQRYSGLPFRIENVLSDLAEEERRAARSKQASLAVALHQQNIPLPRYRPGTEADTQEHLLKLATAGVLLTPESYLTVWQEKYAGHDPAGLAAGMRRELPGIYGYLRQSDSLPDAVREYQGWFRETVPLRFASEELRKEACTEENRNRWILENITDVFHPLRKQAHSLPSREACAMAAIDYAVYKLAALLQVPEGLYMQAVRHAVRQ
jgi:hypothetical protein